MRYTYAVSIVPIPAQEGLQQIGAMVFYPNGTVRLAEHTVDRGVPIDGLVFAGGYEAHRRLDRPTLLFVKEPGNPPQWRTFEYYWIEQLWREHVAAHCPEYLRRINRYGRVLGQLVHELCEVGHQAFAVMIGCAATCIVVALIAGFFALLSSLFSD